MPVPRGLALSSINTHAHKIMAVAHQLRNSAKTNLTQHVANDTEKVVPLRQLRGEGMVMAARQQRREHYLRLIQRAEQLRRGHGVEDEDLAALGSGHWRL
jgi:hypothetical protein